MKLDTAMTIGGLLAASIAGVIIHYIWTRWPVANYPPGPWGVPILGSLLSFRSDYHRYFMELGEKYGSVCSYAVGQKNLVIVNGIESITEAIVTRGSDIADRPGNYGVDLYNPEYLGIADAHYGERWQHQRHFTHKTLRGFGFGKTSFEGKIMEEVDFLIGFFKENSNKPLDVQDFITNCVANIICSITFGQRYNHFEDPEFRNVINSQRDLFSAAGDLALHLGHVLPFIRPFLRKQEGAMRTTFNQVASFVDGEIEKKRERLAEIDDPQDFIESYLKEMESDGSGKYSALSLKYIVIDLFAAGVETTSTTLAWAVLHMMSNPEVQSRIQDELDKVIGRDTLPSWAHKGTLPYTEAALLEVQRIASLVPTFARGSIRPTTIGGYNIPANTEVWINLWSVHRDPKLYPQPDTFDPRRFLTEDGKLQKSGSFMPFGAGRRVCMGESLAKMELFLFFTAMLHRFSFSLPEGATPPPVDGILALTHAPKPFKVIIEERAN